MKQQKKRKSIGPQFFCLTSTAISHSKVIPLSHNGIKAEGMLNLPVFPVKEEKKKLTAFPSPGFPN